MKRTEIFARDSWRCVYCGTTKTTEALSIDHVQPRVKGGDSSGGNVVTACTTCNTLKGARSLSSFLAEDENARRNFFLHAKYVWPRHLRAVIEELARRGHVLTLPDQGEADRRREGSVSPARTHSDPDQTGPKDD